MARQRQSVRLRGIPAAKINIRTKVAKARSRVGRRKA